MNAAGCGTVEVNPPQHSIKQREKCGLAMASVRNFTTFGPYRPVALQNHRLAKKFFGQTRGADPGGDGTPDGTPPAPPNGAAV
jgi:hypothetical protein